MRIKYLSIMILLLAVMSFPQTNLNLTGRLSADTKLISTNYKDTSATQVSFSSYSKKSVALAGILSGIMPGAGEVYIGGTTNYIKAGALVLIEAVSIYYDISYNKRGDAQTNMFQNYADNQWSVVNYAEYLGRKGHPVTINNSPGLTPWQRVNWAELNAAEDSLGLSHHLPIHGSQQYYELIGKYPQYSPGWNQYVYGTNTANPTDDYHYLPPQFDQYAVMRGNANDLYKIASRGAAMIYVNHALGILDAVWSAVSFNKDIALNFKFEPVDLITEIDYVPTVHIQYGF